MRKLLETIICSILYIGILFFVWIVDLFFSIRELFTGQRATAKIIRTVKGSSIIPDNRIEFDKWNDSHRWNDEIIKIQNEQKLKNKF